MRKEKKDEKKRQGCAGFAEGVTTLNCGAPKPKQALNQPIASADPAR
jgi:hypothetical protein